MKKIILIIIVAALSLSSCVKREDEQVKVKESLNKENTVNTELKVDESADSSRENIEKEVDMASTRRTENIKTIYLAGGCFWGVEGYFSKLPGVVDAASGYANGNTDKTDYHSIAGTGHAETVKIDYDISVISLDELLLHYFKIIDPKSLNKQGNDVGTQYRTGVYYTDDKQKEIVERFFEYKKKEIGKIVVEKEEIKNFILAEDYHQDYLDKNPNGYCHVDLDMAYGAVLGDIYENPSDTELKEKLDDLSYDVLRKSDTERAGTSELEGEYRKGIYVDKASGAPLFASKDKFDSGCGWPSFSKPILTDKVHFVEDNSLGMMRLEVRSIGGDNHLGHVFNDGPKEKGGLRYCINGAALEFIPFEEMDEKGYGEYKFLCE